MPIYEYKCYKCAKTFEILQSFSAEPLKQCIHCNGKVKKVLTAPSFQFKGSGWYITDYKKNKENKKENKTANETKETTNANIH